MYFRKNGDVDCVAVALPGAVVVVRLAVSEVSLPRVEAVVGSSVFDAMAWKFSLKKRHRKEKITEDRGISPSPFQVMRQTDGAAAVMLIAGKARLSAQVSPVVAKGLLFGLAPTAAAFVHAYE
jgi:hypothetical protein